jgi:hypothetical protein
MAAAANRNRSTPWETIAPISPADPRRPTTKRLEGRSVSGVTSISDALTTELTAPLSTVTWLATTMLDDGGWTTTIYAHGQVEWTLPPMLNRNVDDPDEGEPEKN